MNNMTYKDFYFWMCGFISAKSELNNEDLNTIQLMLGKVKEESNKLSKGHTIIQNPPNTYIIPFQPNKSDNKYDITCGVKKGWDYNDENRY